MHKYKRMNNHHLLKYHLPLLCSSLVLGKGRARNEIEGGGRGSGVYAEGGRKCSGSNAPCWSFARNISQERQRSPLTLSSTYFTRVSCSCVRSWKILNRASSGFAQRWSKNRSPRIPDACKNNCGKRGRGFGVMKETCRAFRYTSQKSDASRCHLKRS